MFPKIFEQYLKFLRSLQKRRILTNLFRNFRLFVTRWKHFVIFNEHYLQIASISFFLITLKALFKFEFEIITIFLSSYIIKTLSITLGFPVFCPSISYKKLNHFCAKRVVQTQIEFEMLAIKRNITKFFIYLYIIHAAAILYYIIKSIHLINGNFYLLFLQHPLLWGYRNRKKKGLDES